MKASDLMGYLESLVCSWLQHVRHVALSAVPVWVRVSEVAGNFAFVLCWNAHQIMINHEAELVCFFVKCCVLPYATTP